MLTHLGTKLHEQLAAKEGLWLLDGVKATEDLFTRLGITGVANDWLLKMPWKRSLAWLMYGDLLGNRAAPRNILEIGGSLSYITLELARRHRYRLLEKANHETADDYRRIEQHLHLDVVQIGDWFDYDVSLQPLDLLIANDLFPNTDQRLYELIDRFLPLINELRLSLTYYEDTFFEVTRDTSGERLTIRPWGLREVRHFLDYIVETYPGVCSSLNPDEVKYEDLSGSVFGNRRNVIYLRLVK